MPGEKACPCQKAKTVFMCVIYNLNMGTQRIINRVLSLKNCNFHFLLVILRTNTLKYSYIILDCVIFEGYNNSISSYSACLKCRKF